MNVLTYEQLKQRLDAVVAECADLKACAIGWAELYADEMGDPHITEDVLPKTPTTDAALAEVEAKAIEKFIAKKLKQLEAMHPDTHAFGATAMEIRAQINELQAYVVELREGRV